jgi:chromosome partitioning protein
MNKAIAFHSYKGGTGKSTISSNLAAMLATKGFRVVLLDLDVYAPSLNGYFRRKPKHWINDFLFENLAIGEILEDLTGALYEFPPSKRTAAQEKKGQLLVGFSNPSKDEVYRLDSSLRQGATKTELLRKFIRMREDIADNTDADYILIDTSPGIRYWSINSLAVADTIILSMKMDGIDIDGTRLLAKEIYDSFTRLGAASYLLLNRVAGYCTPSNLNPASSISSQDAYAEVLGEQSQVISALTSELSMPIISSIPCYCDIQFNSREYLTALKYPDHPFAGKVYDLIQKLETTKK